MGLVLAVEIKPKRPYDMLEGYFQYANVPGEHDYDFGFNRGNPSHHVSRHEQVNGGNFRTKVIGS